MSDQVAQQTAANGRATRVWHPAMDFGDIWMGSGLEEYLHRVIKHGNAGHTGFEEARVFLKKMLLEEAKSRSKLVVSAQDRTAIYRVTRPLHVLANLSEGEARAGTVMLARARQYNLIGAPRQRSGRQFDPTK